MATGTMTMQSAKTNGRTLLLLTMCLGVLVAQNRHLAPAPPRDWSTPRMVGATAELSGAVLAFAFIGANALRPTT